MGIALAAGAVAALTVPSAASAAVTCSFNAAGQQVDVVLGTNGDQATIRQEALAVGGRILVDTGVAEVPCLAAGVPADEANTNQILISEPDTRNTTVNIELSGGGFVNTIEPGTNPEMEIYLQFAEFGSDTFRLYGTGGDDHWALGSNGINFNVGVASDADMDIVYVPDEASIDSDQMTPDFGDDVIDGSGVAGVLESNAGFRVFGGDGTDVLTGGSGNDSLMGDAGADTLIGRGGFDIYNGGTGDDIFDGATGAVGGQVETVNYGFQTAGVSVDLGLVPGTQNTGADGVDTFLGNTFRELAGSPGPDTLKGGSAEETIRGQGGNDLIDGGPGADALHGVMGNDLIRGGLGNDVMFGGTNTVGQLGQPGDTVAYDGVPAAVSGVNVNLTDGQATGGHGTDPTILGFPNVIGSPFADTITGDAEANTLTGGAGPDQVFGRAGADTLLLRDGVADTGDCGADGDTADVDRALDTLIGCETVTPALPAVSVLTPTVLPSAENPACEKLREKLKKAKKARKKAAGKKQRKAKSRQVRKLKRKLRRLGC